MNNLRLLRGLLCATLLSGGACAVGQNVITLQEIFTVAETNSRQLKPSFTSLTEATQETKVARSGLLPDVNASMSESYIGDGFTTKRNLTDYQKAPIPHLGTGLSLNINQPIYTGGAVTGAIELAELKSTAARYAAELQRDNIRFQLTGFYLDIYKYHNLRQVVDASIESAKRVLVEMRARYEHGTALMNDITRYELLVSNLELQRVKLDNTLEILNNNLVTLAGLPDDTVIVPDSTMLAQSLPTDGAEEWQQKTLNNSSTLRMAMNGVDISRKAEKIVNADRMPKIGLQAGWTMDGPILVEIPPINRNLSYWYVGVGISYNISSLFKTNKSIARSRTATRKAVEEYDAAVERTRMEVQSDYIRYLEAYEELKTQNKSVELAGRNYRTTATRYSEGMALITDMLDAANSRLDAEQQLVNARINIIYYYYKLLFVSGTI